MYNSTAFCCVMCSKGLNDTSLLPLHFGVLDCVNHCISTPHMKLMNPNNLMDLFCRSSLGAMDIHTSSTMWYQRCWLKESLRKKLICSQWRTLKLGLNMRFSSRMLITMTLLQEFLYWLCTVFYSLCNLCT
jgi:hypothetical protein